MILAIVCGLLVLAGIIAAFSMLARDEGKPSTNQLSGVIVAKHYSGEQQTDISFGSKGLKKKVADTGYSFDIKVTEENRVYEVPVDKILYNSRNIGDRQSFIRPPSEQH